MDQRRVESTDSVFTPFSLSHRFKGGFDAIEIFAVFLESAQLLGQIVAFRPSFLQLVLNGGFLHLERAQAGVKRG